MNIDRLLNRLNQSKDKWQRIHLNLNRCKKIKNKRKKLLKKKAKKMNNQKVLKNKMMLKLQVKNLLQNLKNKVKEQIFQNKMLIQNSKMVRVSRLNQIFYKLGMK